MKSRKEEFWSLRWEMRPPFRQEAVGYHQTLKKRAGELFPTRFLSLLFAFLLYFFSRNPFSKQSTAAFS